MENIKLVNILRICVCKRLLLDYCIYYFYTTGINDAQVFLKIEHTNFMYVKREDLFFSLFFKGLASFFLCWLVCN